MINSNEVSPVKMSQEQKQDIMRSILKEESMINITLKPIEQEVFLTEDPQVALIKLKCFQELINKERLAYAEHLAEVFEMIGDDAYRNLGFILKQFVQDSYSIQLSIIRQLPLLVEQIKKRQSGYAELKDHVLPFMNIFIMHEDFDVNISHQTQIKKEVLTQLIKIAPFLIEQDKVDTILAHLIEMAHDEKNNQNRMLAATTFGQTASLFSMKYCESYICGELLALGIDLNEFVREKAIEQLPNLSVCLSEKCIELKIIPSCEDRLLQIKFACIRSISGISKYARHNLKTTKLIPKYLDFISDQNKEVRKTAYEYLGEFISTIKFTDKDQQQLETLLAYYQNQLDKNMNMMGVDLVYKCAYYFPGVLQAIGRARWLKIQPLYGFLLKYPSDKVRISLSQSFHEVAKLLGPDLSKEYLITVLETLAQDKLQEVRNGIVVNLSKFISIFPIEERDYVIESIYQTFQERLTQMANSPDYLCFNNDTIFFQIAPILFKFCSDTVAKVRRKASKNVVHLVETFEEEGEQRTVILEQIRAFSHSKKFNQRQSYCWMCYKLFYRPDFEDLFFERLFELCRDPVQCVRLSAITVIDKFIQKESFSKERKYLKYLLVQFIDDQCKEVQQILTKYNFVIQKTKKKTLSCRSRNSGSSNGHLEDIPEFDEKIEQIRKTSGKV
ncbi:unnamed protein product (macronuclear) [Paramecium tetraurelia]|uniref:Condensin complex subunit 1 C-terminal domain-containing protein n=1 Tax=Paramecium tetraurelia TaxID=5888 RepID=A0BUF7_PARTE|nr:uncharacterized protein GSPATT00032406001 [Paramecium tetraurelia]CAK62174.1 unnamed protein product [Paramecium tetraurelia]|eukprot:XP_001429572.1 hypothetical protein (macronuclear) [Paramecium tetraurelia strain d4-2]